MKKLFLLLLLAPAVHAQTYMNMPIVSVYDGDTIKSNLGKRMPEELRPMSIRIRGIDTPEIRTKCAKEKMLGHRARAAVELLAVGRTSMKVENYEWGKYARIVADVKIGGVDVANHLIERGLAVPYDGGTKTHNWCD